MRQPHGWNRPAIRPLFRKPSSEYGIRHQMERRPLHCLTADAASRNSRLESDLAFDFRRLDAGHGEVRLRLVQHQIDEQAGLARHRADDVVLLA